MNTEKLKQEISDKELRVSQLRTMDINKLTPDVKKLLIALGQEIDELKKRLGEE